MNVYSISGTKYQLGTLLGSGGEGNVYRIEGEQLAAKIYKKTDYKIAQKIQYMLEHPIAADLMNSANSAKDDIFCFQLAWPLDIIYSNNQQFIGYVMPLIEGNLELITVERGCDSQSSKKIFPNYTRVFSLIVARNLAKTMDYLHQNNCIIGDLNPKNIFVTPLGKIVLLDADSFDILDEENNIHYRCNVGTEDYLAPELQGRNLASSNAFFSIFSDYFSLAIHIFQLLMMNYHPFTGRNLVKIKNSSVVNQRIDRIVKGISPFVHEYADITIPSGAPKLEEILPGYLIADFYQTFCYTESEIYMLRKTRTTASQWTQDLNHFITEVLDPNLSCICQNDNTHFFLKSQEYCGFCKAKQRMKL